MFRVYGGSISLPFSRMLCISPPPGCEEVREERNVRNIRALADKAGVRILQFQKPPGEAEQESKPRALHELRVPALDEVRDRQHFGSVAAR